MNSFWRIEHQTFADDFLTCQLKNVVLKRVVLNLEKNLKYVFSNPALKVRTGSSASTSYSSQRPPSTASLALNEMVHKSTDLPHVPIRFFLWRSVIFVKPFRTICSVQASPFFTSANLLTRMKLAFNSRVFSVSALSVFLQTVSLAILKPFHI